MKKFFFFCMMALVTMCGLNSCSDDCNHVYIEYDYSKALVGTWTCMEFENDYAEALIFNADGTVTSTGVLDGGYWEKKGTYQIKGNQMTLSYEDGDYLVTRFEMVEGEVFSLVNDYLDVRYNYYYCENDLSDELVGMWVCNDSKMDAQNDMMIQTFDANGKTTLTGFLPMDDNPEFVLNDKTDYKVVGDLMLLGVPDKFVGGYKPLFIAEKLIYTPNATAYGDIMTFTNYSIDDSELKSETWLRVKQNLNLTGKTYAYRSAYITNAKGADEDFNMLGHTFNMANIKASDFDVIFGSDLYCLVGLNVNYIKHKFRPNGQDVEVETPISVKGNKVTLYMDTVNPACRKVEMYMFQDADDSQLHIYMPTSSFVNYFANLGIPDLIEEGKLDPTDAAAVEKVYADMEARVESINLSFVMKAIK